MRECRNCELTIAYMTKKMKKAAKNILIIEDETMLQETLVESLELEGYSVRGCTSSGDAFKLIKEEKPDLILTDLVMVNVDGYEVLRALKENLNLKDIPVLVITNLSGDEHIEKAKELGADDVVVKSGTTLKEITQKVTDILK